MVHFSYKLVCESGLDFLITESVYLEAKYNTCDKSSVLCVPHLTQVRIQELPLQAFLTLLTWFLFNKKWSMLELRSILHRPYYLVKHLTNVKQDQNLHGHFHVSPLYHEKPWYSTFNIWYRFTYLSSFPGVYSEGQAYESHTIWCTLWTVSIKPPTGDTKGRYLGAMHHHGKPLPLPMSGGTSQKPPSEHHQGTPISKIMYFTWTWL